MDDAPKSKSRKVNAYVRRMRQAQALEAKIEAREASYKAALAPYRSKLGDLQAEIHNIYAGMNGGQIGEARRLLTPVV